MSVDAASDQSAQVILQWYPIKKGHWDGGELLFASELFLVSIARTPTYYFSVRQFCRLITRSSGVTRLQWARVQVFQKGPLFPTQGSSKTA